MVKATPMVQQYLSIKEQYPDAILFYRMGDFYEMFFEDAQVASGILEIALTARNKKDEQPIPMCGVPYHAAQTYVARLIEKGFKVAICEQVEDPATAKGLVKREVTRVVTPGVVLDVELLDEKSNNFLLAFCSGPNRSEGRFEDRFGRFGVAHLDISTGEFRVTESQDFAAVLEECRRIRPREALVAQSSRDLSPARALGEALGEGTTTYLPDERFDRDGAQSRLLKQFKVRSLEGFGCHQLREGIGAAGALLHYVDSTHKGDLVHVTRLIAYSLSDFMVIDEATRRNLELFESIRGGAKRGTLIGVMDCTKTAMGGRMLKRWIQYPLLDVKRIRHRLDGVEEAKDRPDLSEPIRDALREIRDLERLNGRIALDRCTARDLAALRDSVANLPRIHALIKGFKSGMFSEILRRWDDLEDLRSLIEGALCDDPPPTLREGGIIKPGFSPELDELVQISRDGKDWILRLEEQERQATGIHSLKVGFNKVFGYYIEVSRTHVKSAPAHYVRKQTLVGAERYITDDLKAHETKVLGAEEKRIQLEYDLFCDLRRKVCAHHERIAAVADLVSHVDALVALADLADRNDYVKPEIHEGDTLFLRDSRHPVVEKLMTAERFVPNTIEMDNAGRQVLIITGPNMAGKSTILRQVALLALMIQMGSFVPAKEASIGIVDRIFTRVGASDDLASGRSTFMVEMEETANILNTATERSLVVLDEIGRGTSTFDGLSIAWAVAEYLHDRKGRGVKTLFATHYHELTDMALTKTRVKNCNVAVKEWNDEIIFLRKLVEGGTNRSYGIQVARLAGVPEPVLKRAKEILKNIEAGEFDGAGLPQLSRSKTNAQVSSSAQLTLFKRPEEQIINRLKALDVDTMTPLEALNELNAIKDFLKGH